MPDAIAHLQIIGPGRAGLALGSALLQAGAVARLSYLGRSPTAPRHPLFRDGSAVVHYHHGLESVHDDPADAVLIAVPDRGIAPLAEELARAPLPPSIPILHLSGAFGSELLAPLDRRGNPTGSLHPLVALADADATRRLRGAWFAVEGSPGARGVAAMLVASLGGRVLRVGAEGKPLYHAGAVAASNFVVAILGVAERWLASAGVPIEEARPALVGLAAGAVENVGRGGPADALTGPVARGDTETVRAHLARLSPTDAHLYSVLALSALTLASERGLTPHAAAELARLLESTE